MWAAARGCLFGFAGRCFLGANRVVGCFSQNGRASRDQTQRPALPVALPKMAPQAGSVAYGYLTAWCCFSEPACLGFPSCRRCSPNRAGRAGSSRAAQTAGHRTHRNGPDFTPSVRCDSRRGADTTGSPNRPPAAKRADKQGTDRTGSRTPAPQRDEAPPSRSEAPSGGAAGGPAPHALDLQALDLHALLSRPLTFRPSTSTPHPKKSTRWAPKKKGSTQHHPTSPKQPAQPHPTT